MMNMDESAQIEQLKRWLPECLLPDQVRLGSSLLRALGARQRGRRIELPLRRWLDLAQSSIAARHARGRLIDEVSYPSDLPITARKDDLVSAIRENQVVVIAGETGSGKSTQLPKMCVEAGLGIRARIGCTQPRRVAALSISRRLAEELGVEWGRGVGCKIRFSDRSRPETSIKVMTDGILLAEVQGDPMLSEYEAIVVDEAHERSLNIDFLLGHLKQLLGQRQDLKLIITSATIDTARFAAAFGGAPIIEVSGRLFPVEVRYRPHDPEAEETGDLTYIDAAVEAVGELVLESVQGDLLVFMPGERDIRETCNRLTAQHRDAIDIVPLFGRLTAGEQQQVFAPGGRRRVVVATNIAETSLTVPRIRYVVDTGLARLSRYHAPTRSRRLPVEEISQSSANQRMGRCGRVMDGVCVRLYGEEDYAARPAFTEPEIQRCNLAEVVLRLKAWHLGEVENFPFLEPPPPAAIRGAYQLLQELGALDDDRRLTGLGRDLARLPVDPAIGRMLLEAQAENALSEVLVVAAGLSIQDPRERPLDRKDEAEAAHRQFRHARSDFLTLLNIWNAYHDTWEELSTQNQMRKFCREHFLSFVRMREWRDVHAQLREALDDLGASRANSEPADYVAIHRSILTGLWGHVAQRIERNQYRLPGGRTVHVFPGSGLFLQGGRKPERPNASRQDLPVKEGTGQPAWIVAGEMVETSRAFARTLAGIEPAWIIELAPHLCRWNHHEPRWDSKQGRVLVREQVRYGGLVLRERMIPYGPVDPVAATALFIQSALVEGNIERQFAFLEHNRRLRQKIELWQTRLPHRVVPDLEEALCAFYAARLSNVSSVADLNRVLKSNADSSFLHAAPVDLLGSHTDAFDVGSFPDALRVGNEAVPVDYAYAPGEEHDGVTMRLTVPLAAMIEPGQLDWLVPSLREERIADLLRRLPKALRRPLMPLPATARVIAQSLEPKGSSYLEAMSAFVRREYGVEVPVAAWPLDDLPVHLRPRYELVGQGTGVVEASRDLHTLRQGIENRATVTDTEAWDRAAQRWERYGLTSWELGDVPESVVVTEVAGLPLLAYPGLTVEQEQVQLRIFRRKEEAEAASRAGIARLAELSLRRELAWLHKELQGLEKLKELYVTLGPGDELMETAWENLRRYLFPATGFSPLTTLAFEAYVAQARARMNGSGLALVDRARAVLMRRQEALLHRRPLPNMRAQLDALVPRRFLERVPFERLVHLPRYVQALSVRADRAALNPAKDAEKWNRIEPYVRAYAELWREAVDRSERWIELEEFGWLLEEYKVSSFAQELGTAMPVSAKRLDEALSSLRASTKTVRGLNR
jgi:ATP-dependent helicase HrpA